MNALVVAKNLGMEFSLVKGKPSVWGGLFGRNSSKMMALNNLNFTLEQGDRLAILGMNGAGKSTLLKILSKVLRPSHGEIYIQGSLTSLLDLNTDIIPQASCIQNIHLKGYALGLKQRDILDYESYVRDKADLEKFIHSPVSVLSAGMKTRLLVSMIGYKSSEILVMDEWIGTADKSFYEKSNSVLNALVEDSNVFILASHNRKLVERLCNKAIVLVNGESVFMGDLNGGFQALDEVQPI